MREILFRGFHECENGTEEIWTSGTCQGEKIKGKIKGEWVEGCYVYDNNLNHHIRAFDNCYYAVVPETVGQFTGLKDKNGNEIYEGDKVVGDVGNGYNRVPRLLQRIGIVQYGNKSPGFTLKIINRFGVNENGESDFCDFQGCGVSFGAFGNMEVIGTIFDKEEIQSKLKELEDNND